jgi:AcrR family transcriptional regulator
MQYLSQRLASKPAPKRGGDPPREALPAPQRERILDAAERLIAERGCSGSSIEAIVKAAGVSSVTFYEFFADKEACFVAAFDRAVEAAAAEIQSATQELSWSEQIATGLRTLLAMVAAEPAPARLCLIEAQTGGPALSAHFEAALDRVAAKLREGRSLDTAPATLPATLEEATAGSLAWMLREQLERDGGEGVEALYPQLVDIALAPYLGDG